MKDCIHLHGGVLVAPDGTCYFPHRADYFDCKAHDLGHGHLELSAKRPRYYLEGTRDDLTHDQERQLQRILRDGIPEPTDDEIEARRARCLAVSQNRRKTAVRKHCKAMAANTLLTLTFKENVLDLAVCKEVLRAFVRRLKKVCPGFRAIAVFERQDRGAWHVHMATTRDALVVSDKSLVHVKSYNVIRAIWRAAAGDLGGNIDVSRRKRSSQRSPAKLAGYLSKYMTKQGGDAVANANMWTKFGDVEVPPPVELGRALDPLRMLVDLYGLVPPQSSVSGAIYSKWGDWFFLAAERPT